MFFFLDRTKEKSADLLGFFFIGPPQLPRLEGDSGLSLEKSNSATDSNAMRAKFHAKVFGPPPVGSTGERGSGPPHLVPQPSAGQVVSSKNVWVPPRRSILAYFTAKPPDRSSATANVDLDYDSDKSYSSENEDEPDDDDALEGKVAIEIPAHANANSYAWAIMRLATCRRALERVCQFVNVCGFEMNGE